MSKAVERGKTYALHKAGEKLHDYYGNAMLSVVQFDGYDIKNAYIEGYHQAEKDLELTWNNVNDRLPKEEFDDGYTFVFVAIKLDEETYRFDVDYIRNGKWELHPDKIITHWMSIPPLSNTED